MQIRDVNTNKRLVLYLDKAQVKQLTALIKNVPSVLDDMAEE
jgi:hypothetical protein